MSGELDGSKGDAYLRELRRASTERWEALPAPVRTAFDVAKKASMTDALLSLGVRRFGSSGRDVELVHQTLRGTLVVSVWHDHIEREADGSLAHWIDAYSWQPEGRTARLDGSVSLHAALQRHAGREVFVLLLKRGWGEDGHLLVELCAPDLVMWRLEAAGQQWFVLRRPMLRRVGAAPGDGAGGNDAD
jgi:hypothetical protein